MSAQSLILLSSFLIPIGVFAYMGLIRVRALAPSPKGASPDAISDELLLASRSATEEDFRDSSVAYMLQVSTTFYFVFWGYHYGFANLFYLISWGIGLYLFSLFASRLDAIRTGFQTIPLLLSGPKYSWLRRLAALTTIVGFLGVVYVETYFASDFMAAIVEMPTDDSSTTGGLIWWVFFVALISTCLTYSCLGGLRKVFFTDKYQLGLGYLGIAAALVFALVAGGGRASSAVEITGLVAVLVYGSLLVGSLRRRQIDFKTLCLFVSVVAVAIAAFVFESKDPTAKVEVPGLFAQVSQSWGWVTLLGFTILNLLWQFCDTSNYQRIAALSMDEDATDADRAKRVRRSLRSLILASPLTWGLGIVLGMSVRIAGVETTEGQSELIAFTVEMQRRMNDGDLLAFVGLAGLGVAFASMMLSTSDSAVVASLQVFGRDILAKHRLNRWQAIAFGVCVGPLLVMFAWLHTAGDQQSIYVIMAAVYTQLVVLALPVLLRLFRFRPSPVECTVGIVIGSIGLWVATFGDFGLPINVKIVLPILLGVLGSALPTGVVLLRGHREPAGDSDGGDSERRS